MERHSRNSLMIDTRELSYTYRGAARPAVRQVSFAVERGEIFGFLGPSGAGKSTIQKVLIGLLRDYAGAAEVLGSDLASRGADFYERIGVSFEFPNHFLKLTAAENLTYFAALYSRPTLPAVKLLELLGLAADADVAVGQYSKGMKNRLSVARALLHRPELLFLDEPTAGLDPVNARRIREIVRAQQAQGTTVFLTTHDMSVADELCDRVAFIVDGEVRMIDRPRDLKLRYGRAQVVVEYCDNGATARREFPLENLGHNTEYVTLLKDRSVETMHSQEATLEDVFVAVTGRSLL